MKKNLYLILISLLAMTGCGEKAKFFVTGTITQAADTMLYLEHLTLGEGVVAVDSIRLDEDGMFVLSGDTCANPEFYRLRIGGQCINLCIDSTETVCVNADLPDMSFGYTVEGSGACDTIRILCLKLAELEKKVSVIAQNRDYTMQERDDSIARLIAAYKDDVKINIIQNNYGSPASYFACFQVLGRALVFDPIQDKSDLIWLRAVTNAWNERYPGSLRTQNLINIVDMGNRNLRPKKQIVLDLDDKRVQELGIIDMTFPDARGVDRTLSSLRGNVVLLDFTAYAYREARERTILMRELYQKYHDRGFEIYQVSVDADRHFWQQQTEALPWVNVFCAEGMSNDIVGLYQVRSLPMYFLIDRDCNLVARMDAIADLDATIEGLLK